MDMGPCRTKAAFAAWLGVAPSTVTGWDNDPPATVKLAVSLWRETERLKTTLAAYREVIADLQK